MGELNWFDIFWINNVQHSRYIKFNDVNRAVYNRTLENIIYEIGENNFKKGIKRIIANCKVNVSGREVKTLIRTQKRKLKYSDKEKSNIMFCPKSICYITQAIFNLYTTHRLVRYSELHLDYYHYLQTILYGYGNRYSCAEIRNIISCLDGLIDS